MYNRNTVTMTVTDYSGPVTIEASCAAGGVFTSTTSFTKTVTSGQSFARIRPHGDRQRILHHRRDHIDGDKDRIEDGNE